LGNLYVEPLQNVTGFGLDPNTRSNIARREAGELENPLSPEGYVYNDGDGSTAYDVEVPIQIGSFDGNFHQASEDVQPLPFAQMYDNYPMLNGRGYPDSANPAAYNFPATLGSGANATKEVTYGTGKLGTSQPVSSHVTATAGDRVLFRISNLNVTNFYTLATNGLTMKVVGNGARILHGGGEVAGLDHSFETNSVTLGGGEAVDVIVDTAGIAPGVYFLYTTNLNFLSNAEQDYGGMMTEIEIL